MDVCIAVLLEFNIVAIMKFGKHSSFLQSELSVASNIDHHVELCTTSNIWTCVHSTESR